MKNPLFKKKATSLPMPGEGVGGIDLEVRENAENAGNPRAEEPLESPFGQKGTFACAKCGAEYPDGNDLVNHAEATGHDPVEEEIQDATFFKESEPIDVQAATQSYGPIPPMGANPPKPPAPPTPTAPTAPPAPTAPVAPGKPPVPPTPGEKPPTPPPATPGKPMSKEQADALNALTQTASVNPNESIEMHETPQLGAPNPGAQRHIDRREQQAITDSIDKPVQHRIGAEEGNYNIGDKVTVNHRSKYEGKEGTIINIVPTSHGTTVYLLEIDGAPADMGFVKEDFDPNYQPSEIEQKKSDILKDVLQRKSSVEVEEHETAPCPNCSGKNHNVVDEEDGEKLIECSDCGSFFTI